jgi:hypothetical protein
MPAPSLFRAWAGGTCAHPRVQERKERAASLKKKGNDAYQGRKFVIAAEFYSRAIAVSPEPEPVFYSNRAACYVSMEPPQHEKVVADCDQALKLDSRYVKALNRRATALEALERYEEALQGTFWFGHKTHLSTPPSPSIHPPETRSYNDLLSQTSLLLRFLENSRMMPRAALSNACWKSCLKKKLRRFSP